MMQTRLVTSFKPALVIVQVPTATLIQMQMESRTATPTLRLVSLASRMAQNLSKLETHGVQKATKASGATRSRINIPKKSQKNSVMKLRMMESTLLSLAST